MPYPGLLYPPFYPGQQLANPTDPPTWFPAPQPGWRCIATRINGDGTETPLTYTLPVQGLKYREDLSGPGAINGTLTPEHPDIPGDWFLPWRTGIYVEESGLIRAGAILNKRPTQGPNLQLNCVGFTGFPVGQPFDGVYRRVGEDPADIFRFIWGHLQTQPHKNLGLFWNDTKTKIRIGDVPLPEGKTKPGNDGPYTLNWWETDDLGAELGALAAFFDYRVDHEWGGPNGDKILHKGTIGYPRLGAELDVRIVVGENIFEQPQIDYHGDMYATEVIVLGAGEGRDMCHGSAQRPTNHLGKTVTISDDSLTTNGQCDRRARQELALRGGDPDISQIELLDHPHAPVGTIRPGDDVRVTTRQGWEDRLDIWVRVLSKEVTVETGRTVLDVTRVERV